VVEKETFPLFVNVGRGQFDDRTSSSRIAMDTYEMSGWSNAIVDLDNDGWKELMVARGNVQNNAAMFSPRHSEEPASVFRNLANGRFQNVSGTAGPDFQIPSIHRGL